MERHLGVNVGWEVVCEQVVVGAQDAADQGLEVVLPPKVARADEVYGGQEALVGLHLDPLLPQLGHLHTQKNTIVGPGLRLDIYAFRCLM